MGLSLVELLSAKRDGRALEAGDWNRLIDSLMNGALADYQMSALLMAIFLRGMSDAETVALTEAMLHSGKVLDLNGVEGFKVDKHSTGGVGDKVSICLAPLVASCGVPVPMVSGRGLGHTGGTLDKLEAIPGFQTQMSTDDFARIVRDVGTCMIGQTSDIAPADKRMYALRDVTATVESIPLIVSSILSKKLAEGIDGLVLDVKVGRGAFMKDEGTARALAQALVRVGTRAGKKVVALMTDMNAPLGDAVGNAIETREALEVLNGRGPLDVIECTLSLGAEMLKMGGKAASIEEARAQLTRNIQNGKGARVMEQMIDAQGGDPRVVEEPHRCAVAEESVLVLNNRRGCVADVDALEIGLAAVSMGAGRARAEDAVDPGVGIEILAKVGAEIGDQEPLARLIVRKRSDAERVHARIHAAFRIQDEPPRTRPLVLDRIEPT